MFAHRGSGQTSPVSEIAGRYAAPALGDDGENGGPAMSQQRGERGERTVRCRDGRLRDRVTSYSVSAGYSVIRVLTASGSGAAVRLVRAASFTEE
ncbi:hypothetical protein NBG84_19945 [Streptomyces sp. CWNU-1]|uniref:Uncharacterized protein n=1 Tax=Streptomyces albipurpureus TaxID=2897419 RepID=A0ABT0UQA0_9ACTN|nr:hypothetical protein [Streptomyces sp. CWNU-1]